MNAPAIFERFEGWLGRQPWPVQVVVSLAVWPFLNVVALILIVAYALLCPEESAVL